MNNIALFVTHTIFLTKDQANSISEGKTLDIMGHCVPVWVDAKTGRTTEPSKEIFCLYRIHNSEEKQRDINVMPKKGYEIFMPNSSGWSPPPETNYEKIALWPSEERMAFLKEMEKWWFSNPKPPDVQDLKRGYVRFEIKKNEISPKSHQQQHVVEISFWDRLKESLAT